MFSKFLAKLLNTFRYNSFSLEMTTKPEEEEKVFEDAENVDDEESEGNSDSNEEEEDDDEEDGPTLTDLLTGKYVRVLLVLFLPLSLL